MATQLLADPLVRRERAENIIHTEPSSFQAMQQ